MHFDPRLVAPFLAIADEGTLGRAAEYLGLTQPALSRALGRLEEQLAATLFDRRPTGMILTNFGEAFLPFALAIDGSCRNAISELDALKGLERGVVRIGAVASAVATIVPRATGSLLSRWPGLSVSIVEDVEDRVVELLMRNQIDLAITGEVADAADLMALGRQGRGDLLTVVARKGHPLESRTGLELGDVLPYRWAMPHRPSAPRRKLEELFARSDQKPNIAVETRSILALKTIVARTDLLSWLPEPLFGDGDEIVTLDAAVFRQRRSFQLYRRQRGFFPPHAQKMAEQITAAFDNEG